MSSNSNQKLPDCKYCETWMNYGTDKEELGPEPNNITPDWDIKKVHMLLKLLYLGDITIEQFKKEFTKAGMDYNIVEHCCGCAGCYDDTSEEEVETHSCPDFNESGGGEHECKIRDPVYCNICGQKAEIGYPMTDDNGKEVFTFWTCEKHTNNPKIENALRRGIIDDIIKID
jgi:hypothetical protein